MKKLLILTLLLLTSCSNTSHFQYTNHSIEEKDLHIFKINPQHYSIHLKNSTEAKTIRDWQTELNSPLVVNAFYFNEDHSPSGYLEIDNQIIKETKFDLDKSGLISTNPFQIIDTKTSSIDFSKLNTAAQSFPFLIKNGKNPIKEDSGKIARRTFIGIDQQQNIYIGITRNFISLHKLGNLLEQTNIPFHYVLNLDGGPSTGLYSQELQVNSITKIPSIIYLQEIE